jgi:hypothetical protein
MVLLCRDLIKAHPHSYSDPLFIKRFSGTNF